MNIRKLIKEEVKKSITGYIPLTDEDVSDLMADFRKVGDRLGETGIREIEEKIILIVKEMNAKYKIGWPRQIALIMIAMLNKSIGH
jgi:hypothetical protein